VGVDEKVLTFSCDVLGRCREFRLAVPSRSLSLADLVPLARRLSSIFVCEKIEHQHAQGPAVSCRKGCSACCHYLVPLSLPEALRMGWELETLPPAQRSRVGRGFSRLADELLAQVPVTQGQVPASLEADGEALAVALYSTRRVPCPLLKGTLCGQYDIRPINCREHITACSPEQCASPSGASELALPLSLFYVLSEIACQLLQRPFEQVYMPLLPSWYRQFSHLARMTWPAETAVGAMIDSLTRLADRARAASA
jgi:Fe-S-cluster containining protein